MRRASQAPPTPATTQARFPPPPLPPPSSPEGAGALSSSPTRAPAWLGCGMRRASRAPPTPATTQEKFPPPSRPKNTKPPPLPPHQSSPEGAGALSSSPARAPAWLGCGVAWAWALSPYGVVRPAPPPCITRQSSAHCGSSSFARALSWLVAPWAGPLDGAGGNVLASAAFLLGPMSLEVCGLFPPSPPQRPDAPCARKLERLSQG